MKIGDYVRTDDGLIGKVVSELYEYKDSIGCDIDFGNNDIYNEYEMYQNIIKSSPNIIDLIEPMDLMFVDIDNGYEGGIIVPRIAETQNELKKYIDNFKNNTYQLKGIITHEQIENMEYRIGE